ncbi:MAG: TIGR01459 family HAD-type hydrolase [Pseudomonadota bacterium]
MPPTAASPNAAPGAATADHGFKLIPGLSAVADQYEGFILDLWGVLHDGVQAYEHAVETLQQLKATGKPVCLLSNAPRREAAIVTRLNGLGLTGDLYDHLVTSGEATHQALKNPPDAWHKALGPVCYALSPHPEAEELTAGTNKQLTDDPHQADFLLAIGIGHADETLDDYRPALDAGLARSIPLVCANPDLVVNAGGSRLAICAGAFAQYYQEQGGDVAYHGKPHGPIYDVCRNRLNLPVTAPILAIGDSMATDVTGAKQARFDACLITSGIHLKDVGVSHGTMPDTLAVQGLITRYGVTPDQVTALCKW